MPQQGQGVVDCSSRGAAPRAAGHAGDRERDAMSLGDELEALRTTAGVVDTSERGEVLVSGPDAWSYLQNLVSADLDTVGDGDGVHSLLLTPQGKLDVDFRLLRVGDEAWLDFDPGFGEQLAASLNRFRIRVKCDVAERTGSSGSLAAPGPGPFCGTSCADLG